ncbi:DUF5680 domain-containing protein [Candidatus Woesearchaeota archaeon]|nr:DUF5680 domain-containing protein [Candidatus Woesearchaeota archaeon]MCF8013018.1 DUF5680 domain-containing protein [Candidatus Woesearchaeota archaeon]
MEKEKLLKIIAKAHKHTYAAPTEIREKHKCETPILDGHKDYEFIEEEFSYHDSYAGNYWAPGREVVFFQKKPIWCMSYQGQHNSNYDDEFFEKQAFIFLKKALMNFDENMPFRGPKEYSEGDFKYTFEIEGNYEYFKGQEKIFYKGEVVFFQDVMGTLIK